MIINFQELYLRRKKIILLLAFIFIIFGIVLFGFKCYYLNERVKQLEMENNYQKTNRDVVNFLKLFIEKILQGQNEVSFEDRLKLENAVRDLGDKQVLTLWENFTQAKTSDQAQYSLKELLEILVNKISY